jgi:hypothetical protein
MWDRRNNRLFASSGWLSSVSVDVDSGVVDDDDLPVVAEAIEHHLRARDGPLDKVAELAASARDAEVQRRRVASLELREHAAVGRRKLRAAPAGGLR